jgi:hypothetical protein
MPLQANDGRSIRTSDLILEWFSIGDEQPIFSTLAQLELRSTDTFPELVARRGKMADFRQRGLVIHIGKYFYLTELIEYN